VKRPDRLDREEIVYWARWCFDTCIFYGCDPATAGYVAGHFADALRRRAPDEEQA
jgi:hypothetical protein